MFVKVLYGALKERVLFFYLNAILSVLGVLQSKLRHNAGTKLCSIGVTLAKLLEAKGTVSKYLCCYSPGCINLYTHVHHFKR